MGADTLLRLALAGLRRRWALPAALFAAAAFCLCFAGAIDAKVRAEQAMPCKLVVSAAQGKSISDETLVKLRVIPGITAATAVLEAPLAVTTGKYSAKLTLTGVESGYLNGIYAQGGVFPAEGAMPYIVLNMAACWLFAEDGAEDEGDYSDGSEDPEGTGSLSENDAKLPAIDWLNAGFALQADEGTRPVAARVCGILDDVEKNDPPAAYASLSEVEALLRSPGQALSIGTAWVRVENIGRANEVSRALAALALTAADDNTAQQSRWDTLRGEMRYLLALAILALLTSMALLRTGGQLALLLERPAWRMLTLMGAGPRMALHVALLQGLLLSLGGAAVGIGVALTLPSFLPPDMAESVFALAVPGWAAVAAAAVCAMVGMTGGTSYQGMCNE